MKNRLLKRCRAFLLLAFTLCIAAPQAHAVLIKCTHGDGTKIVLSPLSGSNKPAGLDNASLLNLEANLSKVDIEAANVFQFGASEVTQIAQSVKDAEGNTYITGGFTGTIEFGSTTLVSSNGFDVYIAKLDSDNNVLWAGMASGSTSIPDYFSLDGATSLAVDDNGNTYVAGTFVKSLTFQSANGDTLQTVTDGRDDENLNFELFVAKYSTSGDLEWVQGGNSGSTGLAGSLAGDPNIANTIILDEDGFPYVAGTVSGNNLFGETTNLEGNGDFFLASLDKDGNSPFWTSTSGTPEYDYAVSVSVDTLGYLNVLGVIGEGKMNLPDFDDDWINDTGANDTFVISYDITGEWYFVNFIGGGDQAIGNDIATAENGDFFVVGEFNKSLFFPGSNVNDDIILNADQLREGFIAKYDLQGDIIWAKSFGGGQSEVNVNKVTTDMDGNVYVLGRFYSFVTFESSTENEVTLTTDSENDMFVAKYDAEGNFVWAKPIESTGSQSLDQIERGEEQPISTQPLDFAYSSTNGGEFILTGDFDGTLNLDDLSVTSPDGAQSGYVATYSFGEVVSNEQEIQIVGEFKLLQNYPNPFNPSTTLGFTLAESAEVTITIHNSLGQLVQTIANKNYSPGRHQIVFDGSNLSSGTYFYSIRSGTMRETKMMTLLK